MARDFVCIVCPRGCELHIDDNGVVSGNFCPRGSKYAIDEITCPRRTLTSSVRVANREDLLVSVKTDKAIRKEKMFEAMEQINAISVNAPCKIDDVLIKDFTEEGVNLVITKNID